MITTMFERKESQRPDNDALSGIIGFSIGICASDSAPYLPALLDVIESERLTKEFALKKIIIVASACSAEILYFVRAQAARDTRILLIEEGERHGKASAVNRISENSEGEYLLFVNADALPERESISKLLRAIEENKQVGVVSACPVLDPPIENTTSKAEELMWNIHNEASLLLNHMEISNHSSDEMMIVRRRALESLPEGLVNDGAYIAGRAKLNGYLIKFCKEAKVRIDVPTRLRDLLGQRRRIIYGHIQVRKITGRAPRTVVSLLFSHPLLSFEICLRTIRKFPRLIPALPVAVLVECLSNLLALGDSLSGQRKHGVWKRYGS